MPELPEVEVTRLGLAPHLEGQRIADVIVRNAQLRWPVPAIIGQVLPGLRVQTIRRRGKFILIDCQNASVRGTLIVHLGMTGTLRILPLGQPFGVHDHIDITFGDQLLRYNDPRRFGALLWHGAHDGPLEANVHLAGLGVEPLTPQFDAEHGGALLFAATRGRSVAIKQALLAGRIVVGVGNIYASESLFRARINPRRAVGKISRARYDALAAAIRETLASAIDHGGSTLRNFVGSNGARGYFQQEYFVYDRGGLPCRICATPIRAIRQGQRSTFYCPQCQRY